MDKIRIQGLQFYGFHGVYPEENKLGQRFRINIELELPLHQAGCSDKLQDTVNYAEVCSLTQEMVEGKTYRLLEALAEAIASAILASYSSIIAIQVQVIKIHPPIKYHLEGIEVEIYRKRES